MANQTYSNAQLSALEKRFRTNLINSLTGFKSVALIGTQSTEGSTNLAIFSQIIHVGANPPLIGILFRPHTVARHTLENILATKHFSINHIRRDFVEKAHHTSARWEISEFEGTGLTPDYADDLLAPFVSEASVKVGLSYVEHHTLRCNETVFLVGEIQKIILPEYCVGSDGFIDLVKAETITCSGLDAYHQVASPVRFAYAKASQPVVTIDN
ncbi:flavin reductase family protein [Tunicatimonas pelagia]|uniref:flavin reductase family protein n=1 Tax=Tunicatimonas pelagia TaxID=931531 RepID=UPI0026657461|nr:flavin reductase [Tunicatimonas pelagia]WKN43480.1 flavin reductase [Tunicatimonas pelagia]